MNLCNYEPNSSKIEKIMVAIGSEESGEKNGWNIGHFGGNGIDLYDLAKIDTGHYTYCQNL